MINRLFCFLVVFGMGCSHDMVGGRRLTIPQLISHEGYSTVALVWTDYDNRDTDISDVGAYCSGVWLDQEHILTAYHCVVSIREKLQLREDIRVLSPLEDGEEFVGRREIGIKGMPLHYIEWGEVDDVDREPTGRHLASVVGWDDNFDLAILKARGNLVPGHDSVKLAGVMPGMGEKVYICGHPRGLYWTFLEGNVAGYRGGIPHINGGSGGPFLQVEAPLYFGNSGGGVFNEAGELVGMADFLIKDLPGEGFYIPVESIKKFLIKNKINLK